MAQWIRQPMFLYILDRVSHFGVGSIPQIGVGRGDLLLPVDLFILNV